MAAAPTRSREGGAGGSDDGSTSLLTDDEKRCCWNVDVEKAGRLLDLVKKSSDAVLECRCFKEELLRLSGLFSATDEYSLLKEILDRFLTIDKKHFCDASEAVLQEEAGKFHAVVAGSYPAKLANAVKRSTDVDVFVVVTDVFVVPICPEPRITKRERLFLRVLFIRSRVRRAGAYQRKSS